MHSTTQERRAETPKPFAESVDPRPVAQSATITRTANADAPASRLPASDAERLFRHLAALIESLPAAVVVLDCAGVIRLHNEEAAILLGNTMVGCAWSSAIRNIVRQGGAEDGNIQMHDGRWLSLSRRHFAAANAQILLLTDVTSHAQLSELRRRQERLSAIGEMTAEFAHQVRTPLAAAILYVNQLGKADGCDGKLSQRLKDRLLELNGMVDDMLCYAAGGNQQVGLVDVCKLFRNVKAVIEPQLGKHATLQFLIDGSSLDDGNDSDSNLSLYVNEAGLSGALANLINNAQQAAADINIHVGAWQDEGKVHFTVIDDGPGVDDDILKRIFDPFFTTRPQGTGLGLAVVRDVADAHGGQVDAVRLKRGMRFTLSLPAWPRPSEETLQ